MKVQHRETRTSRYSPNGDMEKHIVNRAKPAPRARGRNQAALIELIARVAAPCDALVFGEPVLWLSSTAKETSALD